MLKNKLQASARMALAMGIFLPLLETIRRSNQILHFQYFFHWFDDYILGALLIIAAVKVLRRKPNASLFLLATWAATAGVLVMSLLFQINLYFGFGEEEGVISMHLVALVKGLIVAYSLIGLSKCWESVKMKGTT